MAKAKTIVVEEEEAPLDHILVKAGPRLEPGKVAIWERHPDHPHEDYEPYGEIYVAYGDATPIMVALTPLVDDKIRAGELVQVSESRVPERRYSPAGSDSGN